MKQVPTINKSKVRCAHCGKRARCVQVIDHDFSRRWFQLPLGWLADQGLGDTGELVCSVECAKMIDSGLRGVGHGSGPHPGFTVCTDKPPRFPTPKTPQPSGDALQTEEWAGVEWDWQ
jgi:hypothetical protein